MIDLSISLIIFTIGVLVGYMFCACQKLYEEIPILEDIVNCMKGIKYFQKNEYIEIRTITKEIQDIKTKLKKENRKNENSKRM